MKARAIAFYLPQFHPIPENDNWWGKGFTEWSNVAKAKPLFPGHYQPQLPADLGFYDLRVPEVREAQANLAREHGIEGFCYYHYWFNGRRLLERPVNEILATGNPDFPFCLCWANENWTRRWDGFDQDILIKQDYSLEDDLNHIRYLSDIFCDRRYIKINGRPLFLIYKLSELPHADKTIALWRDECKKMGVGNIFLCNVESSPVNHALKLKYDLDAAVEFAPDWSAIEVRKTSKFFNLFQRGLFKFGYTKKYIKTSYSQLVKKMLMKNSPNYLRFPCVTPSWDNSARRDSGSTIFFGSSPEIYFNWLSQTLQKATKDQSDLEKPIIFINAWNEWAEGNHLEPCQKWGMSYLEATKKALR